MARDRRTSAAACKETLDDAVLERVERDDDDAAAWLEDAFRRRKTLGQLLQFLIDENAQRLKRSCGRMDLPRLRPHHAADDIGKHARGGDRRLLAARHDGARDKAG